jgi:hypothetical protein
MGVSFARKREIWWPTAPGWLVLLAVAAAALALGLRFLYPFLAVTEPVGARIAVVEGWLDPAELDAAIARIREGRYEIVVTTGGPLHTWPASPPDATFAHRAAAYLHSRGIAPVQVVPSPITRDDRTYKSAALVREWARAANIGVSGIDVYSRGPHARRSRFLYREAFGGKVPIGVIALRPEGYDAARWWRSSAGARDVLEQASGLLWTLCFFRAPNV